MWQLIFGFAIVSACYLLGKWIGMNLGAAVGVGDIGGVAFGMLFLVLLTNLKFWSEKIDERIKNGVAIASALYLPVIVAMVYKTNVIGAFQAGPVALVAGFLALTTGLLLVNQVAKIGPRPRGQGEQQKGG